LGVSADNRGGLPSATTFSIVYGIDALVALAAAAVMWRRRQAPAAPPLTGLLLGAAFWALCDAIELQVTTVAGKQLVSQLQYFGVVACAPCFFEAAMVLCGERWRMTRVVRFAVWSVPAASVGVAWTNDLHHWLWTAILLPAGNLPFATYKYGWWFWVLTAQNYVLMIAASALLVRGIRDVGRGFRTAMAVVLVATLLPWIGNVAYNLKLGPWPGLNWLTLSLGVSGWLLVWVVLREGLLDLLPQARGALIEMMADGVLVIDRAGRITFSNGTARDTLGLDQGALLSAFGTPSLQEAPVEWRGETQVDTAVGRRWLDLRVGPVFDRWGDLAGRIVVARDVTVHKELEDERERLIDELQEALRRVTQLEGLLPICAGCHNVRDDGGAWNTLEDYVETRTPVEFTHAICPDCAARLYPELGPTRAAAS
jgi:PAS domain-containing protein